jgi:hypothetical protein
MVDRLAVRDGEQPRAEIAGVIQLRVRAECGDEGLLEAVLGVMGADGGDQEAEHVGAVLVEQCLEGGKRFI